jgi:hypothetical protein
MTDIEVAAGSQANEIRKGITNCDKYHIQPEGKLSGA